MVRKIFIFTFLHISFVLSKAPKNNIEATYDPSELLSKIFNVNETIPRGYGLSNYEGDQNFQDYGYMDGIKNYSPNHNNLHGNIKYSDDFNYDSQNGAVKFQDNNNIGHKKKRKRKQKQNYGFQHAGGNKPVPGFGNSNAPLGVPGFGNPNAPVGGQYYRPPSRPSIASTALSAVTDALTSIALYDDSQCVARLLCEAAGGGALGSSGILQTVAGLQPLLTLLSAYNGISTNPLFVFGRAVFLGMSSKGNTASCRYAYPQCPTDPEQLVHYLNNHNGGFFRFFNAPHLDHQNVQQLYDQLTQNYGLQPSSNYQQQNYGLYNPLQQNVQNPNLYSNQQNYGLAYPYDNNNIRFKENTGEIQRRIQNKPNTNINGLEDLNTRWTFPSKEENNNNYYITNDEFENDVHNSDNYFNNRETKALKFPENNNNYEMNNDEFENNVYNTNNFYDKRQTKFLKFPENNIGNDFKIVNNREIRGFSFPERQSNGEYNYNNNLRPVDNKYVSSNYNNYNFNNLDNLRTVYVVRGNGDPNHPEVIKLRPGETIS